MWGLNSFALGWLEAMTGNGRGNISFDPNFQKAVLVDAAGFGNIMPKVPKGMKHIKNCYFYVRDQVVQGNIDIVHSPADAPFPEDQMWADVLTKP